VAGDEEHALAVYQALRSRGRASAADLRRASGLPAGQVAAGLARLRELGLVQQTPEGRQAGDGGFEPVEPDAALTRTVDAYRETAARQAAGAADLQQLAQSLMSVYRPAVARESAHVEAEFISDRRMKDRTLQELVAGTRESVDSAHPGPMPPMEVLEASLRLDRAMTERGVRLRAVYPRSIAAVPRYAGYLRQLSEAGVKVRLIDRVAYDLLIVDRLAVCLPADPDRPSGSMLLVRGSALVKIHVAAFEDCWLRAVPFEVLSDGGGRESALNPQESLIVKLMASGLSDDQIARRMGVHRRTVQRAVTKLMERLGAASRFEAGLLLALDGEFARTVRGRGRGGRGPGAGTARTR